MFKTRHDRATSTETHSPTSEVEAERSRLSPGPLAGVEPLIDHAIDPDADETLIDDALTAANEQDRAEPTDQAPALVAATLAERRGLGIVRLVWGTDGEVIETMGSWRPLEGAEDAPPAGTQARFVGTLYLDGRRSVPIDTDVVISGGGTYIDLDGNEVRLVRFTAPSLVADSRFARA